MGCQRVFHCGISSVAVLGVVDPDPTVKKNWIRVPLLRKKKWIQIQHSENNPDPGPFLTFFFH